MSNAHSVVMTEGEVAALPAIPLGPGVPATHQILWHDAHSMAGVLQVDAGQRLGLHTHHANHHHLWLLDGHATILGRRLGPGSYAHIPSGIEHDIDARDTDGCRVFYLYLRPAE